MRRTKFKYDIRGNGVPHRSSKDIFDSVFGLDCIERKRKAVTQSRSSLTTSRIKPEDLGIPTEDFLYDFFDCPENCGFIAVEPESMIDQRRWVIRYSQVFRKLKTDEFYMIQWDAPATEMQEVDDPNITVDRVYPKVVEKVVYTREVPR